MSLVCRCTPKCQFSSTDLTLQTSDLPSAPNPKWISLLTQARRRAWLLPTSHVQEPLPTIDQRLSQTKLSATRPSSRKETQVMTTLAQTRCRKDKEQVRKAFRRWNHSSKGRKFRDRLEYRQVRSKWLPHQVGCKIGKSVRIIQLLTAF